MRRWIVMIDDDVDMHFIYQKVFENLGIAANLRLFDNGGDALEFLEHAARETRLIFSDINMPVMDGLQLRSAINQWTNADVRSIPFIFLSTSARERELKSAYELFAQGVFQKGETLQELEDCIRIVMSYWGKCRLPETSFSSHHA